MSGRICIVVATLALAIPALGAAEPGCGGGAACAPQNVAPGAIRLAQAGGADMSRRPVMRPHPAELPPSMPFPSAEAAQPPAAAIPGRPVRRATPAAATPLEPPAILPAAPAPTAPAAPLASWSLPVPAGCPTPNMLAPGENRIAGEVRGEAICRLLIPADTASRVTLVGPGPALPDLKVVLYSRTTTDLAADQPLPVPPGRQELRVLRAPQAPGRTPLPFDLLIRLD
ncbi:hypothetical protein [Paracoccus marinus]|uniref:hypothetical protein n=1 Tax=Paracoccus marinus TaxID=288426 RepID=UPI00103C852E|nr:hypothetical protein [Paracoccus marinus]